MQPLHSVHKCYVIILKQVHYKIVPLLKYSSLKSDINVKTQIRFCITILYPIGKAFI